MSSSLSSSSKSSSRKSLSDNEDEEEDEQEEEDVSSFIILSLMTTRFTEPVMGVVFGEDSLIRTDRTFRGNSVHRPTSSHQFVSEKNSPEAVPNRVAKHFCKTLKLRVFFVFANHRP